MHGHTHTTHACEQSVRCIGEHLGIAGRTLDFKILDASRSGDTPIFPLVFTPHIVLAPDDARVLDYCCGSGVIGASLALRTPSAQIELLDNDAVAIAAAKRNVAGAHALHLLCGLADIHAQGTFSHELTFLFVSIQKRNRAMTADGQKSRGARCPLEYLLTHG